MFNNNRNNNIVRKGRTYNFVLNSNYTINNQTFGGNNIPPATCNFYVDWSVLPEGEYKVSFTYTSAITATMLRQNLNCLLYLDLGQASTSMLRQSAALSNNATRGSFLGCLRPKGYAVEEPTDYVTFLHADKFTNPPIYLFTRPRNNNVSVQIFRAGAYADYSPLSEYILTLSFELQ